MIYRNLAAELIRSGADLNDIPKRLNITQKTFRAKMNGESDWAWPQVCALRKLITTTSDIDYLFAKDNERKAG